MSLWTITSAAEAMRRGELSPGELVEQCLQRIARYEPSIHAWVSVDEQGARKEAERLAAELARGFDRGPLHGIPIGIKDIIDVAGWPTQAGSPLRRDHRASQDAPLVARLRAAGAIILGKTVTTEFACFDPPPTRNPWNLDRTPGGSSSGSAAAVATGMCLGAIGTQTGGSIIRPASFCGVCGCKPAHGSISLQGIVPVAPTLDHPGPVARSVADLEILLRAILNVPPSEAPVVRQLEQMMTPALPKIFDMKEIVSNLEEVLAMHRRIMAYEAAQTHRETFPERRDQYGPCVASLLDEGLAISLADYQAALTHRDQFRRKTLAVLEQMLPVYMTPATVGPAPGLETTGDPRFNSPWSYAGLPVISIPCGLSNEGLPMAMQLIGHPERMEQLFTIARMTEEQFNFTALPPLLQDC
jgi:aspartyl-tRNA(Asn)/glutamyl-tRNA(Gln) amidotransferase subunit A